MKSLMLLLQEVLLERGTWCRTSTSRDWKTISARVEHEGLSFLTIALPAFAKDFEKSLDVGKVDRNLFQGFSWKGGLPRFLGGFLDLVFDRGTGLLLDSPDIEAIRSVRQICLMFGKVLIPCSDARNEAAIDGYIECEKEVRAYDNRRTHGMYQEFSRMSVRLWADVFTDVDARIYDVDVMPKHGPGQTADRLTGNRKYRQTEWPERLDAVFPHGEFLVPNLRYTREGVLDYVELLEPGAERPVKVTLVPKTLKSPRIIAMEPTAMMYGQQAIAEILVEGIEGDDILSSFVGFRDQTPNQEMARIGSLTGTLATLDLSEASDRVSNQLVRTLVTHWPHLAGALDATRSRKADVPGRGVIRLAKYASMGSALCFPIEALVFATIIFLGIQDELGRPLTKRDLKSLKGQVRVYGDDIIVPVDYVQAVIRRLEDFGLRVNAGKSFWTGKFRESCGKEYYAGEDVTIVRVRRVFPSSRQDADEVISLVSLRNQLYKAGSWRTCMWLDDEIRKLIPFPVVSDTSPVQGRHSFLGFQAERYETGETMQRPLVKGAIVKSTLPRNSVSGEFALLKYFLRRDANDSLPAIDREHLTRSGRPDSVDIKIRWASAI